MESNVHIREASAADREKLLAVMLSAYEQYAGVMTEERWIAYRASIIEAADDQRPAARLIAEQGGRIVGSVLLFVSSAEAYDLPELGIDGPILRLLSVDPSARGRGIATALIREGLRRARQLGASKLHLHTSDMMASAVRLYERLGFRREEEKDIWKGETRVKCYVLDLQAGSLLEPEGKVI